MFRPSCLHPARLAALGTRPGALPSGDTSAECWEGQASCVGPRRTQRPPLQRHSVPWRQSSDALHAGTTASLPADKLAIKLAQRRILLAHSTVILQHFTKRAIRLENLIVKQPKAVAHWPVSGPSKYTDITCSVWQHTKAQLLFSKTGVLQSSNNIYIGEKPAMSSPSSGQTLVMRHQATAASRCLHRYLASTGCFLLQSS